MNTNKVKLAETFENRKEQLKKSLVNPNIYTLVDVITIVNNEIKLLTNPDSEYRQNLSDSESKIVSEALGLIYEQQNLLNDSVVKESSTSTKCFDNEQDNSSSFDTKIKDGIITVGATAGAFAGGVFGAFLGGIFSAGISELVFKKPLKKTKHNQKNEKETLSIRIDINKLLNGIQETLKGIDDLVFHFQSEQKKLTDYYENLPKPSLEKDYYFILEQIQILLGTSKQEYDLLPISTKDSIKYLEKSLSNEGIKVIYYDNSISDELKEYFYFDEDSRLTSFSAEKPAFVKKGKAILTGLVYMPTSVK